MDDETGADATAPLSTSHEEEIAHLRELYLRLLTPPHAFGPQPPDEPALHAGALPPGFPAEIPIPENARLLGSLVSYQTVVVYDTELPRDDALAFYRERLGGSGWSVLDMMRHHGGFMHGPAPANDRLMLCKAEAGPSLTIIAASPDGRATAVRLEYQTYDNPEHSPCGQQRRMRHHMADSLWDAIPALYTPADVRQQGGGGNNGPDFATANARLETSAELALADLATHYDQQLARAGWTRRDGGTAGPVAWSAWGFQHDERGPCRGLFLAVGDADAPGLYDLYIRAELVTRRSGPARGGGSSSWYSAATVVSSMTTSTSQAPDGQ